MNFEIETSEEAAKGVTLGSNNKPPYPIARTVKLHGSKQSDTMANTTEPAVKELIAKSIGWDTWRPKTETEEGAKINYNLSLFAIIATGFRLSYFDDRDKNNIESWTSSLCLDSRTDMFSVWQAKHKIYDFCSYDQFKKEHLPKYSAQTKPKYSGRLIAVDLNTYDIIEIETGSVLSNSLLLDAQAFKKDIKRSFDLATKPNALIYQSITTGARLRKLSKEGVIYTGKGDCFFVPMFRVGVTNSEEVNSLINEKKELFFEWANATIPKIGETIKEENTEVVENTASALLTPPIIENLYRGSKQPNEPTINIENLDDSTNDLPF